MTSKKPPEISEKDQARFWVKVALPNEQGCMLWLDTPGVNGYGRFWGNGRQSYAHRVSYELAYGPISEGLQVDHLCRVRHCVAPLHLEAVTLRENVLRGQGVAARHAAKTHCPQGHAYDSANTYLTSRGRRKCRPCNARRQRIYDQQKRSGQ